MRQREKAKARTSTKSEFLVVHQWGFGCTWKIWPLPRHSQVCCPSAGCTAPAPHGKQKFWPGLGLKKSLGQGRQLGEAPPELNIPAGHRELCCTPGQETPGAGRAENQGWGTSEMLIIASKWYRNLLLKMLFIGSKRYRNLIIYYLKCCLLDTNYIAIHFLKCFLLHSNDTGIDFLF